MRRHGRRASSSGAGEGGGAHQPLMGAFCTCTHNRIIGATRGRRRAAWCLAVGALLAAGLSASGAQAAQRPFETFMPDTVWAFFSLDNVPKAEAALKAIPLGKIEDDPIIKKLHEDDWKQFEKMVADEPVLKDCGVNVRDLRAQFMQGQVAAVVFSWDVKQFSKIQDQVERARFQRFLPSKDFNPSAPEENGAQWGLQGGLRRLVGGRPTGGEGAAEPRKVEPVNLAPGLPDAAFLADVGQNRAKIEAVFDKVLEHPKVAEAVVHQRYTYRGVAIHTLMAKQAPKSGEYDLREAVFAYGFPADDLFVASVGKKAMEQVIACYQDRPQVPLSTSAKFRYVTGKIGEERLGTFYVNLEPLIPALWETVEDEDERKQAQAVFSDLGLDALRAAGAGLRVHREGVLLTFAAYAPHNERGLWKLLAPGPAAFVTPGLVPEEVFFFGAMNVDVRAAWTLLGEMLAKYDREAFDQFSQGKTMAEQMLQINIEKDVLGSVGTEVAVAVASPPPAPPLPPPDPNKPFDMERLMAQAAQRVPDVLMLVSLADAKRFEELLDKVLLAAGQGLGGGAPGEGGPPPPAIETEEFQGFKLHVLKQMGMSQVFVVTPKAALVGVGRGALNKIKTVLRDLNAEKGLAAGADFRRPLSLLAGEDRVAVGYMDLVRLMEFSGALLQPSAIPDLGPVDPAEPVRDVKKFMEVLKKYAHPIVSAVVKDADGLAQQVYVY
jgi:hypothetical protein